MTRRRFPRPRGHASLRPLDAALWRSPAFALADDVAGTDEVRILGKSFAFPPTDWTLPDEPRLRRFHLHHGDEVLGWARRGDVGAARAGLEGWIAANPPRFGDAWHPYPLSTRVGNWIAAISIAPELSSGSVVESLRRQLAFLERNVEDDILGNHVIRNARALVLGGAALDDRALLDRGLALVRRELPEQVLSDGGHYERSPVYHLIVLRDLLEIRAAAGVEWLDQPIERMRRFAAALARPDGKPALFNDGTLDLAPRLDLPPPAEGLAVFPETGYAVLRQGAVWLAFDCGPPSPRFLPAHAHADALSFQLWIGDTPIVVDPGTYTYEPGPDRDFFRSTRSHSTVAVAGRDQFELYGAFRAGVLPHVRLLSSSPLEAEVAFAGYRHRRRIDISAAEVVVDDAIDGSGKTRIESSLPLGGAGTTRVDLIGAAEVSHPGGWLAERMFSRDRIETTRASAEGELPLRTGWRVRLGSSS